jgi:hypothetical protein
MYNHQPQVTRKILLSVFVPEEEVLEARVEVWTLWIGFCQLVTGIMDFVLSFDP